MNLNISITDILDSVLDNWENRKEIDEQIEADIYYDGINKEVKDQLISDMINTLNLLIPNLIIIKN